MKDIEPDVSKILSSDKKIDDIEILEYNIDNTKETSISLRVKSSDEIAEYINYFIATYYYSSDDKWVLIMFLKWTKINRPLLLKRC